MMLDPPPSKRFEIESGIAATLVDDELVILQFATNRYLSLNAAGVIVWSGIKSGLDYGQLPRLLQDKFGIDEATARRDVSALVRDLLEQELIA